MRYGCDYTEYLAQEGYTPAARFVQPIRYKDARRIASGWSLGCERATLTRRFLAKGKGKLDPNAKWLERCRTLANELGGLIVEDLADGVLQVKLGNYLLAKVRNVSQALSYF